MSSKDLKIRFDNQFCRMNCQIFSWPLSSGARGGSCKSEMLFGTWRALAPCQPACASKDENGRVPRTAVGDVAVGNLYAATPERDEQLACQGHNGDPSR